MKRSTFMIALALLATIYLLKPRIAHALDQTIHGPYTVDQRLQQYSEIVKARLNPDFIRAGVAYPPSEMTLVVLKQEKQLQLYAAGPAGTQHFIRSYPIFAASGHAGPKLHEGDSQVPEGVYRVESLNPNSAYHLALHVDYPNAFDRQQAGRDGRTQLGGDIMIHGSDVSIGCVAIGDAAAEDVFILSAEVGLPHVRLLFCPLDLRTAEINPRELQLPAWSADLYASLHKALDPLPEPPVTSSASAQ